MMKVDEASRMADLTSKYELLPFPLAGMNVRMDRLTGETEMLMGDGWRPLTKEGWQLPEAPRSGWLKRYSLHLTVLLGFLIWSAPSLIHSFVDRGVRFEKVGENPFIMFDRKTAQACWSGPVQVSTGNVIDDALKGTKPGVALNGLPSCKDIR